MRFEELRDVYFAGFHRGEISKLDLAYAIALWQLGGRR